MRRGVLGATPFTLRASRYPWPWSGYRPPLGPGEISATGLSARLLQELNDKARTEVTRLIALDATFESFTDACTWPDHPRRRAEEHFINVARSVHTITTATCPTAPKCLFTGTVADLEVCGPRMTIRRISPRSSTSATGSVTSTSPCTFLSPMIV